MVIGNSIRRVALQSRARTLRGGVRALSTVHSPQGLELNYLHRPATEATPSSTPLVVMHGLLGSCGNWRSILANLCPTRPKYALDLRNHGNSPHDDAMDANSMVEDLLRTMDSLHIDSCALMGHSLGGKVAMKAALTHPDRFERLVVVDIAPLGYSKQNSAQWKETAAIVECVASLDLTKVSCRDDAREVMGKQIEDPNILAFVLQNLVVDRATGVWSWRINAPTLHRQLPTLGSFTYDADLEAHGPYTKPTLFIAGGASGYLTEAHRVHMTPLFPSHTMETIPRAGHWVHSVAPRELTTLVNTFDKAL